MRTTSRPWGGPARAGEDKSCVRRGGGRSPRAPARVSRARGADSRCSPDKLKPAQRRVAALPLAGCPLCPRRASSSRMLPCICDVASSCMCQLHPARGPLQSCRAAAQLGLEQLLGSDLRSAQLQLLTQADASCLGQGTGPFGARADRRALMLLRSWPRAVQHAAATAADISFVLSFFRSFDLSCFRSFVL